MTLRGGGGGGGGAFFLPQGHYLNKLGTGPLGDTKYQISRFAYISLCTIFDPCGRGLFLPQGYNLNNLGRGLLGDAKYQI